MKCMKKTDLVMVLNELEDDKTLSINDLICLFEAFGDDWFIEGNKFEKFSDNKAMAALRNEKVEELHKKIANIMG